MPTRNQLIRQGRKKKYRTNRNRVLNYYHVSSPKRRMSTWTDAAMSVAPLAYAAALSSSSSSSSSSSFSFSLSRGSPFLGMKPAAPSLSRPISIPSSRIPLPISSLRGPVGIGMGIARSILSQSPRPYALLSRGGLGLGLGSGSRSISTCLSNPRYSPRSPSFPHLSRHFSTDRHLDPYDRYMRRTGVNWGIRFVPQQEAFVIERFGKFYKVLEAGLHLLVPLVDQIAYIHSLKEQTIEIPEQPAVTTDNVSIRVNGVLFVKVIDAERASYGNDNVMYAVTQLAQTVMRSAIGKMPLDKTFMERNTLNANIVDSINDVASQWGLVCRRYEIRDIIPPPGIRDSMVMQAEAERRKRAEIIEAEGKRQAVILTSEAAKMNSINRATGEAEAIRIIADSIQGKGGQAAASLKVAQDYVQAFNKMAKESTTMLLPAPIGDPSSMVASALALYKNLVVDKHGKNTFTSTPADSAGQIEHGEVIDSEEKAAFSLQSTKKN